MGIEKRAKIWGAGVAALFSCLLLLILYFTYMRGSTVEPEEGLAVSMGDPNMGGPDFFEPTPASEIAEPEPEPVPEQPAQPVVPVQTAPVAQELPTQDLEETVNLNKKKTKDEKPKEDPELIKKRQEEQRKKEEAAKQLAEEKARKEAEQRRAEEIRQRMHNSFGGNGKGGNGTQTSNGTGTGKNAGTGGAADGNANGSPRGNAPTGSGNNWSLEGRSLSGTLVRPTSNEENQEGKVVVNIVVDKDGNVIDANIGKGTKGITDPNLRKQCIEAAKKTKFNSINRDVRQTGFITYYFTLK